MAPEMGDMTMTDPQSKTHMRVSPLVTGLFLSSLIWGALALAAYTIWEILK